jgi:hypothetical protein
MSFDSDRQDVLGAFDATGGSFRHVMPYRYTDFIDGMAWVGVLCGASMKAGDAELSEKCVTYLQSLINVAKDARNYAPTQVKPEWKASTNMPGYWYKEKAQASAGPLSLQFAVKCGAAITVPDYLKDKWKSADRLSMLGWAFGFMCKPISFLRQYTNSIWLAHLATGKKPASTMLWMCQDNPLYSYIAGKKCSAEYPDLHKTSMAETVEKKDIVPMAKREPDIWVFKNWPYDEYVRSGQVAAEQYVPLCRVAGDYLQSTL